jgi:hypothetical protein
VTTDVRGEKRFISTIARRLDSLGALTRGQRQTGGQNLFDPADNLESIYAKEALNRWFGLLLHSGKLASGQPAALSRNSRASIEGTGWLDGRGPAADPALAQPHCSRFPIALQNAIFDEVPGAGRSADRCGAAGWHARSRPRDDRSRETSTVLSDTLLRTDPLSGATTHLLELEIARALKPLTPAAA